MSRMLLEQAEQQTKDLLMELYRYALCLVFLMVFLNLHCGFRHGHFASSAISSGKFLIICRLGWRFSVMNNGGSVIPTLLFSKVGPAVSMTRTTFFVWLYL